MNICLRTWVVTGVNHPNSIWKTDMYSWRFLYSKHLLLFTYFRLVQLKACINWKGYIKTELHVWWCSGSDSHSGDMGSMTLGHLWFCLSPSISTDIFQFPTVEVIEWRLVGWVWIFGDWRGNDRGLYIPHSLEVSKKNKNYYSLLKIVFNHLKISTFYRFGEII